MIGVRHRHVNNGYETTIEYAQGEIPLNFPCWVYRDEGLINNIPKDSFASQDIKDWGGLECRNVAGFDRTFDFPRSFSTVYDVM